MIRATQNYLVVECQVKGANSTILVDRYTLAPILKGPAVLPSSESEYDSTQISILEHYSGPATGSNELVI